MEERREFVCWWKGTDEYGAWKLPVLGFFLLLLSGVAEAGRALVGDVGDAGSAFARMLSGFVACASFCVCDVRDGPKRESRSGGMSSSLLSSDSSSGTERGVRASGEG